MLFRVSIIFLTHCFVVFSFLHAQEAETKPAGLEPSPFARMLSKAAMDSSLLDNRRKNSVSGLSKATSETRDVSLVNSMMPVASDGGWRAVYLIQEGEGVDTVAVHIAGGAPDSSKASGDVREVRDAVESIVPKKPACEAELLEPEFLSLRGRMAAASAEKDMIPMVERALLDKCFSLSQVRRLCNIFLYDRYRVEFFEKIYGHIVDPKEFSGLRGFLSDPVCLKRFDLLIGR